MILAAEQHSRTICTRVVAALCILFLLSLSAACGSQQKELHFSGATMGTVWNVRLRPVHPELHQRKRVLMLIQRELQAIDHALSNWREDSELTRFNRAPVGVWIEVSTMTAEVAALSRELALFSGGNFDPTVAPLVDLWGFGPAGRGDTLPAQNVLHDTLKQVDYRRFSVRHDPPALRKQVPLELNFSAIAKGYAVDRVAAVLHSNGARHYLVEIGGELRAFGKNPDGASWRIGIEHPMASGGIQQALSLPSGMALATSGDYHNYRERDGRRYPHVIDPHTGMPLNNRLSGVTVAAGNTARADALATAILVMGMENGLNFAQRHEIAAYFIERTQQGLNAQYSPAYTD